MTNATSAAAAAPAPGNLLSRFIGIIVSPKATFQAVVAHPRWLGMFALTTLIVMAATALPLFSERGKQAALDQQVRQMEAFGMEVNDQMYAGMERNMRIAPYTTAATILIASPIVAIVITGILFAIFNAAMGGEASFKQLFAVVAHAGVISALGQLFTAPINYARGTLGGATNLGVLLPMLDESSFVGRLLGMIDLFVVWWVVVLAIGLAVLYRRRTQPIAMSLFGVYAVIAIGFAAIMSRLGGTN